MSKSARRRKPLTWGASQGNIVVQEQGRKGFQHITLSVKDIRPRVDDGQVYLPFKGKFSTKQWRVETTPRYLSDTYQAYETWYKVIYPKRDSLSALVGKESEGVLGLNIHTRKSYSYFVQERKIWRRLSVRKNADKPHIHNIERMILFGFLHRMVCTEWFTETTEPVRKVLGIDWYSRRKAERLTSLKKLQASVLESEIKSIERQLR